MLNRRGIFGAFAGIVAAPALVRADSIMQIRSIRVVAKSPLLAMPYESVTPLPDIGSIMYNVADCRFYVFDEAARIWKAAWDEIDTKTGLIIKADEITLEA